MKISSRSFYLIEGWNLKQILREFEMNFELKGSILTGTQNRLQIMRDEIEKTSNLEDSLQTNSASCASEATQPKMLL